MLFTIIQKINFKKQIKKLRENGAFLFIIGTILDIVNDCI